MRPVRPCVAITIRSASKSSAAPIMVLGGSPWTKSVSQRPVSEVPIGNAPEPVFDGFFPIRDWFQGPWQTRGDHVDNAHLRPVTRGKTGGHLKSRHRLCLKLYRAQNLSEELSHGNTA